MIRARFIYDGSAYTVWGEVGDELWMCRDDISGRTTYLTTQEINEQLAWMARTGQRVSLR